MRTSAGREQQIARYRQSAPARARQRQASAGPYVSDTRLRGLVKPLGPVLALNLRQPFLKLRAVPGVQARARTLPELEQSGLSEADEPAITNDNMVVNGDIEQAPSGN